jgi:hypothetical protein
MFLPSRYSFAFARARRTLFSLAQQIIITLGLFDYPAN